MDYMCEYSFYAKRFETKWEALYENKLLLFIIIKLGKINFKEKMFDKINDS